VGKEIQNKEKQTEQETWKVSVLKEAKKRVAYRWCPLNQKRSFSYADFNCPN